MFDWSRANETELLQVCRQRGISVSPGTPKETLIKLIVGEVEPEEVEPNPIDEWRDALMEFLLDYWSVVRGQTGCPAKDLEQWTERTPGELLIRRKPGLPPGRIACRTCTDTQVMCCIVQNAANEKLVQIRRRKKT